ncbi:hypothetical protein [Arthrobacter sp. B6]|uniref:hypothetical protein n=1 Tax=Arthrobacter sp. B6 TaxID=1570137 RepID=UPI000831BB3D|nr:hypothetical protein [Arthrobacter sp. B6]
MTTNNKAQAILSPLLPTARRSLLAPCIAVLAIAYGVTGAAWGISGNPFPVADADAYSTSILFGAPQAAVGWGLVVLAGAAALLATVTATGDRMNNPPAGLRAAVAVMAATMCLVALVLVGDARLLTVLGYIPVILATVSYDPQIQEAMPRLVDASLLNLLALAAGAVLWVALAVAVDRVYRGACRRCGRDEAAVHGLFSAAAAARWGRAAVLIAVVVPLVYAVTRICWAFGFPLGVDPAIQEDMVSRGMDTSALGLGGMALAGAVLTMGLVQRWGEVFPRWVPGLAGKRVPISLAVIPATSVAIAVIPASVTMIMMAGMPSGGIVPAFSPTNWAPFGPAFLWPLWGVALAAAALAYYLRRRGTCRDCHRNG